MKILVIGGGVAGPTFCLFCKKFGIDAEITLIERAPEFKNIGFAISLWGNGRKILDKLDIIKNLDDKEGYEIPWDALETPKHHFLKIFFFDIFKKFGPTMTITRSSLQKTLVGAMEKQSIKIKLGTTAKIIENNPKGISVEFSNGSKENFDLLVASDGVRSTVRDDVFGKDMIKPYGITAWVFWVGEKLDHPKGVLAICGKGKVAMVFPIFERAFVMLGVKIAQGNSEPAETRKEYLHKLFNNFDSFVHTAIDSVEKPEDILRTELSHVVMDEWYRKRVVLIGDAQHALSPVTGMGASFAMEDSFVLAEELSRNNIDEALSKFTKRRQHRIRMVKKLSSMLDSWVLATGLKAFLRDNFAFLIPLKYFTRGFSKILSEEI